MGNLSFSSIILIILMVFLLIGAHAIPELLMVLFGFCCP